MQEFDVMATPQQDVQNLITAIDQVEQLGLLVVHSFIPGFAPDYEIQEQIQNHCQQHGYRVVCDLKRLDRARDGHHYDILTARWLADWVAQFFLHGHTKMFMCISFPGIVLQHPLIVPIHAL